MLQVVGQDRVQWAIELPAQPPQPVAVLLGPVALALGEPVAMGGKHPDDAVLQAHHMRLNGQTRTDQLADLFLLLRGDSDGHEVAGPVLLGQMDGIQAVGLAPVAGLLRDQAGGDDLAPEAIVLEAALQDVAGAAGLVA